MRLSICVLTRNRTWLLAPLLEGIRSFTGLETELVIADNSSEPDARAFYEEAADIYRIVPDEVLWYDGFGAAKGMAFRAARTDWCAIVDLGEVWRENPDAPLAAMIGRHPEVPVWSVSDPRTGQAWGRIADRTRARLLGLIHEEFYLKGSLENWGALALQHEPVAWVSNTAYDDGADPYWLRKRVLYGHLLSMAREYTELRVGTNQAWFADGKKTDDELLGENVSFDAWKGMQG
jgi:hypothetical protein